MAEYKIHVLVCGGTGCKSSHSLMLAEHLRTEIKNQGLADFAQVVGTGCFGFCEKGNPKAFWIGFPAVINRAVSHSMPPSKLG